MIRAEKGQKSIRVTARLYGVTTTTVKAVWKDERLSQRAVEISRVKKELADDMLLVADLGVQQVREKISDCNARDAAIVTAVMVDKSRLMNGETTANVGVAGLMQIIHTNEITPNNLHFNPDKAK
jgi:hypothetical protein